MRLVSLAPGLTELCFALGRGAELVAVDEHSDTPPEVSGLPRVGTLLEPDVEAIRALDPDLVLAFELVPGKASPARRLSGSGLPVALLQARGLQGVLELVGSVGRLLQRPRQGAELAARLEGRIAEVRRQLAPLEPPPRVYLELWPRPPLALGRASWIHDLLELAGATNVFGDVEAANRETDGSEVQERDPDTVLVSWGTPRTDLRPVLRRRGWQGVRALREARVGSVAFDALKRPGPRLPEGFAALARVIRDFRENPNSPG